jgi:hypothetical protein
VTTVRDLVLNFNLSKLEVDEAERFAIETPACTKGPDLAGVFRRKWL